MTRNDRFNKSLRSTDWRKADTDPTKDARMSDGGEGAARIVAAADFAWEHEAAEWSAALGGRNASAVGAIQRLVWARKEHLAPTLLAIFENGRDISSSLEHIKKRTYFRARNALVDFFVAL